LTPPSQTTQAKAAGLPKLARPVRVSADPDGGFDRALSEQIARTRRRPKRLRVTIGGRPAPAGMKLQYRLTRHDFLLGCAIAGDLTSDRPSEVRYRRYITRMFNGLTHEDALKWYDIEAEHQLRDYRDAEQAFDFAGDQGLSVRGHCLLWDREKFIARQPWLTELSERDLRDAVDRHITETVSRYAGKVAAWDVINEMLDPKSGWYGRKLGQDIYAHAFKLTRQIDPTTPLFVNEWGILGDDKETDRLIDLIKSLQDQGADVTGIGLQEHACQRILDEGEEPGPDMKHDVITPQAAFATLDRLAELNLPIQITEVSSQAEAPADRARGIRWIYQLGYAHPAVTGVVLWGFWAKRHWLGNTAALVDGRWRPTASGDALEDLFKSQWHSAGQATLDADGACTLSVFDGDYALEAVTGDATKLSGTATLRGDDAAAVDMA